MAPAAIGSTVAYSHLLDTFDVPRYEAHRAFEVALDELMHPTAAAAAAPADPREVLRAQMQAAGVDATLTALRTGA